MTGIVTKITTVRVGCRPRVIEIDEQPWRTTSAATIRLSGLREGDIVDLEELALRIDEAEQQALRERGIALLGYRERSVAELRSKLLEDGYPDASVHALVCALERSGLVNDERFAESLVRSAAGGKSHGRRRAAIDLAARGVADDIALAALDEYMPADNEDERARQVARKLTRPNERVDRLATRLVRKGFSPSVSYSVAREVLSDVDTDSLNPDLSDL
jgi:regulatory protein